MVNISPAFSIAFLSRSGVAARSRREASTRPRLNKGPHGKSGGSARIGFAESAFRFLGCGRCCSSVYVERVVRAVGGVVCVQCGYGVYLCFCGLN